MTPRSDGRIRTLLACISEIVVAGLPSNIIGSATESPTFNPINPYRWVALYFISWMSAGASVADSKSVSDLAGRPCAENPAVAPSGPSKTSLFSHHLSGHLSLINDRRLRTLAHRTEGNNYGSEGWGFESLRARKAKPQVKELNL